MIDKCVICEKDLIQNVKKHSWDIGCPTISKIYSRSKDPHFWIILNKNVNISSGVNSSRIEIENFFINYQTGIDSHQINIWDHKTSKDYYIKGDIELYYSFSKIEVIQNYLLL